MAEVEQHLKQGGGIAEVREAFRRYDGKDLWVSSCAEEKRRVTSAPAPVFLA